jgi:hypothetical protein
MKASLFGFIAGLWLVGGSFLVSAQTGTNANVSPASPPPGGRESWMISFLTPAEQEQYANARAKALEHNPELKTEGENLVKRGEVLMTDGKAADKQEFIENMLSHRQKLRKAMLKEDPSLEPIFAQIDKHISEMKSKHLGQMQSSPGATNNTSPASPSAGH